MLSELSYSLDFKCLQFLKGLNVSMTSHTFINLNVLPCLLVTLEQNLSLLKTELFLGKHWTQSRIIHSENQLRTI
jgi:hypothetical protein